MKGEGHDRGKEIVGTGQKDKSVNGTGSKVWTFEASNTTAGGACSLRSAGRCVEMCTESMLRC